MVRLIDKEFLDLSKRDIFFASIGVIFLTFSGFILGRNLAYLHCLQWVLMVCIYPRMSAAKLSNLNLLASG